MTNHVEVQDNFGRGCRGAVIALAMTLVLVGTVVALVVLFR